MRALDYLLILGWILALVVGIAAGIRSGKKRKRSDPLVLAAGILFIASVLIACSFCVHAELRGFELGATFAQKWPVLLTAVTILAIPVATIGLVARWWSGRRRHPPGYCQVCGFNLTGAFHDRCPECGQPPVPVDLGEKRPW